MSQKFTILFDLDGTLVDTAPDLVNAHNHVMKKFGYHSKSKNEVRSLIGKGAGTMITKSIWGTAKKDFAKFNLTADLSQRPHSVIEKLDEFPDSIL